MPVTKLPPLAETGADELMIVSDVYDHEERLESYEIIAAAVRELNGSASADATEPSLVDC